MSEKWTTGDWELIDDCIRAPGVFRDSDQMADYRGSIICDMTRGLGHGFDGTAREHAKEETLANARLIAAAPSMAKFIDKLANMEILFFEGFDEDADTLIEIKREAAELMALARGE